MKRWLGASLLALIASSASAQMALTGAGRGVTGAGVGPSPFTIQPIFAWPGPAASTPTNTIGTYSYGPFASNSISSTFYGTSFSPARASVMPIAGTLANLEVSVPNTTLTAGNSYQFCIATAAATCSAVTCTINNASNSCSDQSHSLTVTPGSLYAIGLVPAGVAQSLTGPIEVSMTLTSTVGNESAVFCGAGGAALISTTALTYNSCQTYTAGATEANISLLSPLQGTFDELQISLLAAAGTGAQWAFAVFKNGVATSLTCLPAAASLTCSTAPGANPVSVNVGDTITVASCPSAATQLASWCSTATTAPASSDLAASLRFIPSLASQFGASIVAGVRNGPTTAATTAQYNPLAGNGENAAGNTDLSIGPYVGNLSGYRIVLSNLIASQCPSPTTLDSSPVTRAITIYDNGVVAAPTVTIPKDVGGVVTACPAQTVSPQDTVDQITVASGHTYSMSHVLSSTTNAATAAGLKFSMVAQAVK